MPDPKVILGAVVVIIFAALTATYPRSALWIGLGVSLSLYLLLNWRDWFGASSWPIASTALIALATAIAVAGLWWNVVLPRLVPTASGKSSPVGKLPDLVKFATDTLLYADLGANQTTWSFQTWKDRTDLWKDMCLRH